MPPQQSVCVVTGSRAEFGLLTTVMNAVESHEALVLQVVAAGAHLLLPERTIQEVTARYQVDAQVIMQQPGHSTRADDAAALGRGVEGFAASFGTLQPDFVVVLGDRIEAFAAACAASIMGIPLAHIHGGDRASGVADEAMRHAITKLAHLHMPATFQSATRIERMGEDLWRIHVVGSPAIDSLDSISILDNKSFHSFGAPDIVVLMHPIGREDDLECAEMMSLLNALKDERVLVLDPNHDAGREGILRAIESRLGSSTLFHVEHLPRAEFVGLLKRLASGSGVLMGNSSAALIEACALRLPSVDIGPRQSGRERPANSIHIETPDPIGVQNALVGTRSIDREALTHPYGDGRAGERVAHILAIVRDSHDLQMLLRKCNTF